MKKKYGIVIFGFFGALFLCLLAAWVFSDILFPEVKIELGDDPCRPDLSEFKWEMKFGPGVYLKDFHKVFPSVVFSKNGATMQMTGDEVELICFDVIGINQEILRTECQYPSQILTEDPFLFNLNPGERGFLIFYKVQGNRNIYEVVN